MSTIVIDDMRPVSLARIVRVSSEASALLSSPLGATSSKLNPPFSLTPVTVL